VRGAGLSTAWIDERPVSLAVSGGADGDDDLMHITCCDDDDLALCGRPVPGEEWGDGTEETTCPVCCVLDGLDLDDEGECPGCPLRMRAEVVK